MGLGTVARRPRGLLSTGFALLVATTFLLQTCHAAQIKIMIVGDSITHGYEGDFTWRYRLWEWLRGRNVDFDFVGPYTGTVTHGDPTGPQYPPLQGETSAPNPPRVWGGYAAGASTSFDKDHFSVWGRQVAQVKNEIRQQVATYQPDYMLVELGFNDLGWFVSGPQGTLGSMKSLIDNARAAKPNIKFAIANVPDRSFINGRDDLPKITAEYNTLLRNAIGGWNQASSPVKLVEFNENYDCRTTGCPAGYDGLHPNALGEYQIAQAFSKTLVNSYGVGGSVLQYSASNVPSRPCSMPVNFQAFTAGNGPRLTWDRVFGASSYDVRSGPSADALVDAASLSSNRYDDAPGVMKLPVAKGEQRFYQVRSSCPGAKSGWTAIRSAVGDPKTLPGPKNIKTYATADGFTVTWSPPDGATGGERYELITFDEQTEGAWLASVGVGSGTSAQRYKLTPGRRHVVAMVTWNSHGHGLLTSARSVVPGAGQPGVPQNLKVWQRNGHTIQTVVDLQPGAAGYRTWLRKTNTAGAVLEAHASTSTTPCKEIGWLFDGVWTYDFCVSAYNGNQESAVSNCIPGPRQPAAMLISCAAEIKLPGRGFEAVPDDPTTPPTSPPPSSFPPLNKDSTCKDLEATKAREGIYQRKYWIQSQTGDVFEKWHANYPNLPNKKGYMHDWAAPFGVGDSFACTLAGACVTPNCNDINGLGTQAGSSVGLQVMMAMNNLRKVFNELENGVTHLVDMYSVSFTSLTDTFNPNTWEDNMPSTMWISQLVMGFGNLIAASVVLLSGPIVLGSVLAPAVATSVQLAVDKIQPTNPSDWDRLKDIQTHVKAWLIGTNNALDAAFTGFNVDGSWQGISLPTLFKDGAWSDDKEIPMLNNTITAADRDLLFDQYLGALVVAGAWKAQRVWIMSYPMTQDQFNSHESPAGNNDHRLKYYDPGTGRGYFFQAVYKDWSGTSSFPRFDNPPGWSALSDWPELQINQHDVFRSSIKSFQQAGYNGALNFNWLNDFQLPGNIFEKSMSQPGMFRVPICDVNPEDEFIYGDGEVALQDFFDGLVKPRDEFSKGEHFRNKVNSICFCEGKRDRNNILFEDVIDVKGWGFRGADGANRCQFFEIDGREYERR